LDLQIELRKLAHDLTPCHNWEVGNQRPRAASPL